MIGFRARNHPRQTFLRGEPLDDVDDRRTPDSLFAPLHAEHGFTLDAAANEENAKCARFFDLECDGLRQSWAGEIVWCNPPYSNVGAWVRKAIGEVLGGCVKVVLLLPANRCEQPWWQDMIEPVRERDPETRGYIIRTQFVRRRVRFGTRTKGAAIKRNEDRPPFGVVLVVIEAA